MTKRDHWAGAESQRRTQWAVFKRFDVLVVYTGGIAVKGAHDQVTAGMQRDAMFLKQLSKTQSGPQAAPEAATKS